MGLVLQKRQQFLVNTDPQRRCYNGCHFSSELQWTVWENWESFLKPEDLPERMIFWRGLNDYAVSQRGTSEGVSEYRIFDTDTKEEVV